MNLAPLRSVRLLPIVIAAAGALLLLKSVGLVTGGGYVLVGTSTARAAGGGHGQSPAPAAAAATDGAVLSDAVMQDTSPTLADGAATLQLKPDAGGHGAPAGGHEAPAGHDAPAAEAHGAPASQPAATEEGDCPAAEPDHDPNGLQGFNFVPQAADCTVDPGVNAAGDALPLITDGAGKVRPLAEAAGGAGSKEQVLERLGERREALDARDAELEMRLALVEAAERRIDARTAELKALEARINALVEQKKTAEQEQFVGIVAMYETMKPKEAAAIFNEMDMSVLLQVARQMNPRKMAPILARMNAIKARDLTAGLTLQESQPDLLAVNDLSRLPQIVGQ